MTLEVDLWFGSNTGNATKIKELTSFQYHNPKSLKGLKKSADNSQTIKANKYPDAIIKAALKKKN